MKNIAIIGIIAIVAVGFLSVYSSNKPEEARASLTIGVSLPLSGDIAYFGEPMRKGVELAIDEARANGVPVEVVFEDNQFDASVMTTVAQNLVNQDRADVVATFSLTEAKVTANIFNREEVPLLVLWDSNAALQQAGEYVFSNGFSIEGNAVRMAQYAYRTVGVHSVAFVVDNDEATILYADSFKEEFERLGGMTTFYELTTLGADDYRTVLAKLKQTSPEGIYLSLYPPSNIQFVRQVRELGVSAELFSHDGFVEEAVQDLGTIADGLYFHNFLSFNEELAKRYREKYGTEPMQLNYLEAAYRGTKVILHAYEEDPSSVKKGLLSVLGEDRMANQLQPIYQVQNGEAVIVQE